MRKTFGFGTAQTSELLIQRGLTRKKDGSVLSFQWTWRFVSLFGADFIALMFFTVCCWDTAVISCHNPIKINYNEELPSHFLQLNSDETLLLMCPEIQKKKLSNANDWSKTSGYCWQTKNIHQINSCDSYHNTVTSYLHLGQFNQRPDAWPVDCIK